MATSDLPHMTSGTYASSTVALGNLNINTMGGMGVALGAQPSFHPELDSFNTGELDSFNTGLERRTFEAQVRRVAKHPFLQTNPQQVIQPQQEMSMAKRLVQVFIADPNENVPLDKSLLYSGEQKLTDATDQELFYELDIKSILDTYNAERVKFLDKKVKERMEYLEPIKVRELKMVVVTIAKFE